MKIREKLIFPKIAVYLILCLRDRPRVLGRLQKSFGMRRNPFETLRNIFKKIDFSSIFLIFVVFMNFMIFHDVNLRVKIRLKIVKKMKKPKILF